jgi:predicted Zn-dependent protease
MAEAASLSGQAKQAFETRNLGEARQRALELLGIQPENSETHMLLGMIAAAERGWQQASEWLNRTTRLKPLIPEAFRALSHAEEQLHHDARAITCMEDYAAAVGGSPESLFSLGNKV